MMLCDIIQNNTSVKYLSKSNSSLLRTLDLCIYFREKDQFFYPIHGKCRMHITLSGHFFLTDQLLLTFHIPVKMCSKGIIFCFAFENMIVRATCSILYRYNLRQQLLLYRISASLRPVFDR